MLDSSENNLSSWRRQNTSNNRLNKIYNKKDYLHYLFQDTKWNFKTNFLSYVTPVYISNKIANYANRYYNMKKGQFLWDMFGGIGVDTVAFHNYFHVLTTEIDYDTFDNLVSNIKKHHTYQHKVLYFHMDNNKMFDKILSKHYTFDVNIVYFDPPWGSNFQSNNIFDFKNVYLNNKQNVMFLFFKIYNNLTKNIIIKCPYKCFTFENLFELTQNDILHFPQYKLKFIFINPFIIFKN